MVEGASDVAAAVTLGLSAVGRPSNSGGADDLARLLELRKVLVLGENDQKANGAWPGRDGAGRVAGSIAGEWQQPVQWSMPPHGSKDLRAWLEARVRDGLDLRDQAACANAGKLFLASVTSSAREAEPGRKATQAELLVRLALQRYRIGLASDRQPFAVENDGPNIALPLRGNANALRAVLARDYRKHCNGVASASALTDAVNTLRGESCDCTPEAVHLRVARHGAAIIVDIGDEAGRAIEVDANGWRVLERSPVLFRRTGLGGPLPLPEGGGTTDELWQLLNVATDDRPLVLGWLLAAYIPDIPHPVLLFGGEHGSAKSSSARTLVELVDPSPAPLRTQPRDLEGWAIPVAGSWVSAFDNVSAIPGWWSDLLCKGVTGDGWPKRELYSDDGVAVLAFQRVFMLTSIDAGALRGDLGDRVLLIDLARILPTQRRTELALAELRRTVLPRVLGALLELLAQVLAALPSVKCSALPRMADFGLLLAALDQVRGTDAFARYEAQGARIADEVIEGDAVGARIVELVRARGDWSGTAGTLLEELGEPTQARDWPGTPKKLGGQLRRLAPALRTSGIEVTPPDRKDKRRIWRLCCERRASAEDTAQTARPPDGRCAEARADAGPGANDDRDRPCASEPSSALQHHAEADSGRLGGAGDCKPPPSSSTDPESLAERAAIREFDGGMTRTDAEERTLRDRAEQDGPNDAAVAILTTLADAAS
ncbi:MAG: ATP-binding protein [Planctomycetota bacterium]|nr:MAG: ATP-binding protein [Planctomycetota bacterium]